MEFFDMVQRKRMSKVIAIFLAICLIFTMGMYATTDIAKAEDLKWADPDDQSSYDISWYEGHEDDASYTLDTAEELAGLAFIINTYYESEDFSGQGITLGNDISLSGKLWPAIGGGGSDPQVQIGDRTYNTQFKGDFDGGGYTISNMVIAPADSDMPAQTSLNYGLFGLVYSGTVKDVTVTGNADVTSTKKCGVAGIIGETMGAAEIINCHSRVTINTDNQYAGGIVGMCWNGADIRNCSNSGTINGGYNDTGGITGSLEGEVTGCMNTGNVSGDRTVGGLVGSNNSKTTEPAYIANIENCYNTGNVSGATAGGIAGLEKGNVSNSYNTGTVSGEIAGGAFGQVGSYAGDPVAKARAYYLSTSAAKGVGAVDEGTTIDYRAIPIYADNEQRISVESNSYQKVYGSSPFSLYAETDGNGKLTYSSNNESVARISSAGKVTVTGTGLAVITIKASATSTYSAAAKTVAVKVVPKKAYLTKIKKYKKALKIYWKKDIHSTGYQIVLAKNKKFTKGKKIVTVKNNSITSKKTTKLSANKKYYVKIRSYKVIEGKKEYGQWSSIKTKKTK
ncbi:MAG: hypothetical protein GX578_05900 [Clostridiales bacterium]|nr:hypothetical protein [Clostridiales bacterium]